MTLLYLSCFLTLLSLRLLQTLKAIEANVEEHNILLPVDNSTTDLVKQGEPGEHFSKTLSVASRDS